MRNAGRGAGSMGSVTMLLNLQCKIHEIYSLYRNKTIYLEKKDQHVMGKMSIGYEA